MSSVVNRTGVFKEPVVVLGATSEKKARVKLAVEAAMPVG